jgi:ArsR family transcriptional regulator, zinc-responsive transcriptional repressor
MPKRSAREEWVEVFEALASAPRLAILEHVQQGPVRCQEIETIVGLSQPAVSYHLAKLERAGVLVKQKKGTRNCYRIHEALDGMLRQCTKGVGPWHIK